MKTASHSAQKTSTTTTSNPTPFFQSKEAQPFFRRAGAGEAPSTFFFQPKLNIGQPGDKYEREADDKAEEVVQKLSQPTVQRQCADCEREQGIQRQPEEEETLIQEKIIQRQTEEEETPIQEKNIQRQTEEEETPIQEKTIQRQTEEEPDLQTAALPILRKANSTQPATASADVQSNLQASKGRGAPLSEPVRSQMEGALGSDFSQVRIHTNEPAVQMSQQLNAQAFTHGSDIYFNAGKYDTGSTQGKRLLAHELVHVGQQSKQINSESFIQKSVIKYSKGAPKYKIGPGKKIKRSAPGKNTKESVNALLAKIKSEVYVRGLNPSNLKKLEGLMLAYNEEMNANEVERGEIIESGAFAHLGLEWRSQDQVTEWVEETGESAKIADPKLPTPYSPSKKAKNRLANYFGKLVEKRGKEIALALLQWSKIQILKEKKRYDESVPNNEAYQLTIADQKLYSLNKAIKYIKSIPKEIERAHRPGIFGFGYSRLTGLPSPLGKEFRGLYSRRGALNRQRLNALWNKYYTLRGVFLPKLIFHFNRLRSTLTKVYPILSLKKYYPGMFILRKNTSIPELIQAPLNKKIENIAKTYENIKRGDIKVWDLKFVIDWAFLEITGSLNWESLEDIEATESKPLGGIMKIEMIDDCRKMVDNYLRNRKEESEKMPFWKKILIGIGIAAAIAAVIFTGGLAAPILLAISAASGVIVGVHSAVKNFKEYENETAASDVALDPALKDISKKEPSLFAFALDLLMIIPDALGVGKGGRVLVSAIRGLSKAKTPAAFLKFKTEITRHFPREADIILERSRYYLSSKISGRTSTRLPWFRRPINPRFTLPSGSQLPFSSSLRGRQHAIPGQIWRGKGSGLVGPRMLPAAPERIWVVAPEGSSTTRGMSIYSNLTSTSPLKESESMAAIAAERLGGKRIWIVGPEGASSTRAIRIRGNRRITYDTKAPSSETERGVRQVRQDMRTIRKILEESGDKSNMGIWWTGTHGTHHGHFARRGLWKKLYYRKERRFAGQYGWKAQNVGGKSRDDVWSSVRDKPTVFSWCYSSSCYVVKK